MNKSALTLVEGASETLTATVVPEDAEDKSVTFTSDKPEIATVTPKQGTVKAVKAGSATITATTVNGVTATATVTVTAPESP